MSVGPRRRFIGETERSLLVAESSGSEKEALSDIEDVVLFCLRDDSDNCGLLLACASSREEKDSLTSGSVEVKRRSAAAEGETSSDGSSVMGSLVDESLTCPTCRRPTNRGLDEREPYRETGKEGLGMYWFRTVVTIGLLRTYSCWASPQLSM